MNTLRFAAPQPSWACCFLASSLLSAHCSSDTSQDNDPMPSVPEACISQCELAAGECPLQSFPDYDTAVERWLPDVCDAPIPFLVAGACGDGTPFLYAGNGTVTEARFFQENGLFLALRTTTDVIDEVCQGTGYFPDRFACADAEVTEVLCGTSLGVGDPVTLD